MNKIKKMVVLIFSVCMLAASFSGCDGSDKSSSKILNSVDPNNSDNDSSSSAELGLDEGVSPIIFSYNGSIVADGDSLSDEEKQYFQEQLQGDDSSSSSDSSSSGNSSSKTDSSGTDSNISKGDTKNFSSIWYNVNKGSDFFFDGSFLEVKFKVNDDAADGTYPVKITTSDFSNYDAQTLTIKTINGSVTVGDAASSSADSVGSEFTIVASNEAAKQGKECTVKIDLKNNPGIAGYLVFIEYDSSAVELVNCSAGEDFKNAINNY